MPRDLSIHFGPRNFIPLRHETQRTQGYADKIEKKADAEALLNAELAGLEGNERTKKWCELMGVGFSTEQRSEAEKLEWWPSAYHAYLKHLWKVAPKQEFRIEHSLWKVMEQGGPDFKVHGLDRWFKGPELEAELGAIAREPWDLQERIVSVLEVLWKSHGRWHSIRARPRKQALKSGWSDHEEHPSELEAAEKKLKQRQQNKRNEKKSKERKEERWMHCEAVFQSAAVDKKGHTAPIKPNPQWLLHKAREQVPEPWPSGYIWDMAKLKIEDRLTWPSMHDLVMGLALRRKQIEEEIELHCEPWTMAPDTSPMRPKREVRYSPECVRWLITRWLAREHPELGADELEHPSNFLRRILDNLPECKPE